ncbi:NADH-quinone oxidoreductase subunit D [Tessaracoccus bendigoensis DSM 12906]|uniref:NADH-quinone oxidoreductase subunit D n=1 Tax=Tessaracoccus bendigoensis DSM 12906 TaxID=1123357 RepID=A0A1M6H3N6_9ACTN|nr:NADH-quinone oxidoreductase subunit D [Tessaracoccus bendigoensis DSM 12906]
MHNFRRFSIGELPSSGSQSISLGHRHPTSTGIVTVDVAFDDDGVIRNADVTNGYGHRGAEKLFEVRDYRSMIMLADRHDWQAAASGELSLTLTAESAMRLTPTPRASMLRTILAELARVHSHLAFLSYLADGEVTPRLWHVVDDIRNRVLAWAGNRVHPMLNRIGGLASDVPDGWLGSLEDPLDDAARVSADLRACLARETRFRGLAVLDRERCLGYGLSGPVGRAAGLDLDRRATGYLAYAELFRPAEVRLAGDAQARFEVLIDEVGTSIDMIRMACSLVPAGEVSTRLSRRLKVPEGEHTVDIEAPWGIASCLMVSRGGSTPWRVALRTPSLSNLSALGVALTGTTEERIPDVVASLGYTIGDADK